MLANFVLAVANVPLIFALSLSSVCFNFKHSDSASSVPFSPQHSYWRSGDHVQFKNFEFFLKTLVNQMEGLSYGPNTPQ